MSIGKYVNQYKKKLLFLIPLILILIYVWENKTITGDFHGGCFDLNASGDIENIKEYTDVKVSFDCSIYRNITLQNRMKGKITIQGLDEDVIVYQADEVVYSFESSSEQMFLTYMWRTLQGKYQSLSLYYNESCSKMMLYDDMNKKIYFVSKEEIPVLELVKYFNDVIHILEAEKWEESYG